MIKKLGIIKKNPFGIKGDFVTAPNISNVFSEMVAIWFVSFWENLASNEYGFWANVNPAVDHPRWSQKTERVLGGGERETEIYNGYGPEVSALYSNFSNLGDRLFR